jgi:xylulokinase
LSVESLLALDLGTTAIKAAVFAPDGRLLGSAAEEYSLITPRPGWVEQNPGDWWELSLRTLRGALEAASGTGINHRPAALAVSSQGISFVPVDRSGRALGNALCWLDTRAGVEAEWLEKRLNAQWIFEITGKRLSLAYVLPKLHWLRTHRPELFARADCFLMAQDYLLYRLAGVKTTDFSLAGGSMLLDLERLAWSDELLSTCALDAARLPSPVWAGSQVGDLSVSAADGLRLPEGLKLVVGGQDQKVAALGAGLRPGWAAISLGTAAAVSCLAQAPFRDPLMRIPLFPFVSPGWWDLEGVVGAGGAALRWGLETFFPGLDFAQLEALARTSPPGANGVRFYPHLAGATSPHWKGDAGGALRGLGLAVGRADLARAFYEGVAFEIRANLEVMRDLSPVEGLLLFGGGSRSTLWREIIAAVCASPLAVVSNPDVALWGAARLAGFGAGLFTERAQSAADLRWSEAPSDLLGRYAEIYSAYRAGETAPLV